ncbi:MAG TPA: hypothetical protein VGV67_06705 [Solirubrobacteraceae bacterium]|nr:hypothetical protein [Solirubrobacteraceae bacterium]
MLIGLGNNTVITGAFSGGRDGACPMLAAHREGGRTSACSFPEAWDRFTGVAGRRIVRPATEYEVQILRREIEASLEPGPPGMFAEVIAEHQAAVEARRHEEIVAAQEPAEPAEPRRRRIRITGGERIDLGGAIEEHRSTARERRRREAEATGLNWLFEETLVLPDDFGQEEQDSRREFDFDAAESDLLRR